MTTNKPASPKLKRYYHWGEDKPPIHYRDKTSDMDMINSILIKQQEYFFPNNFEPELIYDIGANIGVVAVILANIYPKAIIHAFEPQRDNFEILHKNCTPYQNIHLHAVGLGASSGSKKLWPSDDPKNFGGYSNFIESGAPEDCKILSIARTVEQYGVPDLIKIDCEGAECEILRNFPHLDLVSWITGELHGVDAEYLLLHRLDSNFRLAIQRNFFDKVWHFHAVNKDWTDFGRDTAQPAAENGLETSPKTAQTGDSTTT